MLWPVSPARPRSKAVYACMTDDDACRHVENRGDTADLSVSRSDLDIDRQGSSSMRRACSNDTVQVIVQFNPGVGVAWRPPNS